MTLGTGIFLSTILASIVALYVATKDRWNWKRIGLWSTLAPLSLAALLAAIIFAHEQYSNRPKLQSELWGIRLGMTRSDVIFLKGKPEAQTSRSKSQHETMSYSSGGDHYEIFISSSGFVSAVLCLPSATYPASIQGLGLRDSYDDVAKKFGQPSKSSVSKDGLSRTHQFARYKVFFGFSKGVVEIFGINENELIGFKDQTELNSAKSEPQ